MSDNNKEAKDKVTKEDKLIKSTLIILEGNKSKLNAIKDLKEILSKTESLEIDDNIKLDIAQSMSKVSSSITKSCDVTKHHIKKVNLHANITEEAHERICKQKKQSNVDAARMLLDMHNNGVPKPQFERVELHDKESSPTKGKWFCLHNNYDVPAPESGTSYQPLEIWDVFYDVKKKEGDVCYKHLKPSLIRGLSTKKEGKSLVPACERGLHRLLLKPRNMVQKEWCGYGRKRLAALKDVTNVMFKKLEIIQA